MIPSRDRVVFLDNTNMNVWHAGGHNNNTAHQPNHGSIMAKIQLCWHTIRLMFCEIFLIADKKRRAETFPQYWVDVGPAS